MTELEIEWRTLQPQYTSKELLEIFPEAESYLKDRLERWNKYLGTMMRIVRKQLVWAERHKDGFSKWFWEQVIGIGDGALLNLVQQEISRIETFFKREDSKEEITQTDIDRARNYPLKQLIGTTKDFVLCPKHSEKNPSFYLKKNFGFCFSCGYHCDSIQYLQDKEDIGFVEAVKRLM